MRDIPVPRCRKLRGYAIDPSLGTALLTLPVNELTYKVVWEKLRARGDKTGATYPVGEYLEIVDYDPATGRFYEPVNLDDPHLLAQDGYAPSVSNPQFHQQFVYAVMMTTIKNFEKALGRKVLWAENIFPPPEKKPNEKRDPIQFQIVPRLRVYPHALRQANAYYDPNRKALLFGYFTATPANAQLQLPGSTVFTCLSHDIIAHETTHAILDGVQRRYIRATHPDMRAFHEAFADIVALFQHFSFPEVLRHQIAQTRGDLRSQNLLGQLAKQFGQAVGGYGSLRDAIGAFDDDGKWQLREADPTQYASVMECHQRGSLLVAAIFDAFLNIYEARAQKLIRLATGGTGRLPEGELPSALIDELAKTAAKAAGDVLRLCIRALDYCPPLDLTFGDYLRAIITADFDMVAEDSYGYRVAFIEAFQKRGISPGVNSMAVEDLLYPLYPLKKGPHDPEPSQEEQNLVQKLREVKNSIGYLTDRDALYNAITELVYGKNKKVDAQGSVGTDQVTGLHHHLKDLFTAASQPFPRDVTGLMFPNDEKTTEDLGLKYGYMTGNCASYVVGNLALANRVTPDDTIVNHMVITLIQKRGVRFEKRDGDWKIAGYFVPDKTEQEQRDKHSIDFGGGCTLIFDLDAKRLRYAIKKDIDDHERMARQFDYEQGLFGGENQTYFASKTLSGLAGPFAFRHSLDAESHAAEAATSRKRS